MVRVKEYEAPKINIREIHRYAGEREATDELSSLIDDCLDEILEGLTYKVAFLEVDVKIFDNEIDLGNIKLRSRALAKNLSGCERAVIFAATVGLLPDKLVARSLVTSPAKALVFDAIGAERIESLCDAFCTDIKNESGKKTRPRFSAGYGDLSIEVQREFFRLLDCPKNIGLTLGESLVMTPSKSVTAIVGIS